MKTSITFLLLGLLVISSCGGSAKLPAVSGYDAELARCLKLSEKKKYQATVDCLEVFKSRYPASGQSAEADLLIADNYFRQKEYLLAAESYQHFIKQYPYHDKQDYAYYKSGQAYLKESPRSIARDQQYLQLAAQNFSILNQYFSQSPYYEIAQSEYRKSLNRLAAREYYVGHFYYKYGEYLSSIPRFINIVRNYPGVGFDEKSFYYLIEASIQTNQAELAKQSFLAFEQRYPQSSLVKKARQKMLAAFK